ncbi:unnamed protein product, partial [Cercopithifilaria johnstoni]
MFFHIAISCSILLIAHSCGPMEGLPKSNRIDLDVQNPAHQYSRACDMYPWICRLNHSQSNNITNTMTARIPRRIVPIFTEVLEIDITRAPKTSTTTTVAKTTEDPTTIMKTIEDLTTGEPVTVATTIEELTTEEPTIAATTTEDLTTDEPTSVATTTEDLTTDEPTSVATTTEDLTTDEPTSVATTTEDLTTEEPTIDELITNDPIIEEPITISRQFYEVSPILLPSQPQ